MLTDLEISGLGSIDHVSVRLSQGLNVLTGETGAGKTMVVNGLQWLLGGRADRDKVRAGAPAAVLQARFSPVPASAHDWTDPDDEDLIVLREVAGRGDDGSSRSRSRLAGRMAPVAALGDVLGPVVEIHSQHESLGLADADVQRGLLDRFGGSAIDKLLVTYMTHHGGWREAVRTLDEAERASRDDAREADRLRFEVDEITAVGPVAAEDDALDADIARLAHVEALADAVAIGVEAVTEEGAARDQLGGAVAALRGVVDHDARLAEPLQRLETALEEIQDVGFELAGYAESLESDPDALNQALARRNEIGRLLRKYGPAVDDVLQYLQSSTDRLDLVDGGEERLDDLRRNVDASRRRVDTSGTALRAARTKVGNRLAKAVDAHLSELSMPHARTEIQVTEAPPGPSGCDRVEFMLSANKGQPALPLGRAASGGERSRVALAVKVALADADDTPIMVFDEVDAGIGGETALAVGRKLARLAKGRQVLCVTHLAQLAAFADTHHVISKHTSSRSTETRVTSLDDSERAEELSRMLSGDSHTQAALTHAQELLAQAAATD